MPFKVRLIAGAEKVIAVDLLDTKLDMAHGSLVPPIPSTLVTCDPIPEIQSLTDGLGVDFAIEAIGVNVTFEQSIRALRPRGKAVWIGVPPQEPLSLESGILGGEKMVMTSTYGSARPRDDMPRLLALYRAGVLKLDELISRTYQLEEINEAFEDLLNGEVARGVIQF